MGLVGFASAVWGMRMKITAGNILRTIMSGLNMLTAEIPIPDFAIPYAAPREENTIATLQPIAPKKDFMTSAKTGGAWGLFSAYGVYRAIW
jgi:hypothetical protein